MKPAKKGTNTQKGEIFCRNRRAKFQYNIREKIETGIELKGVEVKSIRQGKVVLEDAFAEIREEEIWLLRMHISPYENAGYETADPDRKRRLLLRKGEILRLQKKVQQKGMTLIPLEVYLKGAWIKVELGVCEGKKFHDKREDLKKKTALRDLQRSVKGR